MSVKRRQLVKYLEEKGFYLLREGKKHSIYTDGQKTIPIYRSSDIAPSIGLRQTSFANRRVWNRSSKGWAQGG